MIRRDFLKKTVTAVGGLAAAISYGAPCPPILDGGSNEACNPPNNQTNLTIRTGALSDGDFFNSNEGSPVIPHSPRNATNSVTWQCRSGFYDPIRRRAHWIGEGYEAGDPWEHYYYDEISNTWVTCNMSAVPAGPGHWRGGCFDVDTGRFFYQREASTSIYWYNPNTDAWAFHSSDADIIEGRPAAPWTTGFHPNLFGPGKPGLIHASVRKLHAFEFTDYLNDPTAGTWTQLNTNWPTSYTLSGHGEAGSATYIPDRDEVMITSKDKNSNGNTCIVVHAGAGLLSNVDIGNGISVRTEPPVRVYGSSGNNKAYICVHPRNSDRILIMNAANSNTWYSDDGGQTWPSGPAHPFTTQLDDDGKMSVTSLTHHGVVMGMTDISGGLTKLCFWRPAIKL